MTCLDKCNDGFHRFLVNVEGRKEWNIARCKCHPSVRTGNKKGYNRKDIERFPNFVSFEKTGVYDYMKQH